MPPSEDCDKDTGDAACRCDAVVQEIMQDPKRNNPLVPDPIEKEIYKVVIQGSILAVQAGLAWALSRTGIFSFLVRFFGSSPKKD